MKLTNGLWLGVLIAVLMVGCSENTSSDQVRRAQLVGHENIQLKKQIDDQSAQIAQINERLEKTKLENERLQKQSVKLEQQHEKTISQLQSDLQVCIQAKDGAPISCPEVEKHYLELVSEISKELTECQGKLEKYQQ